LVLPVPISASIIVSIAVIVAAPSRYAPAATIDVNPGAGTLQAAIDAASDGDHLRLHPGTYSGAVRVTKRLSIRTASPFVVIDAGCTAPVALEIAADGVIMVGNFARSGIAAPGTQVSGGTATQIRIANHSNVRLQDIGPTASECGSEQDGIEVSGSSSNVQLKYMYTTGFPGAGVHLSGLAIGAGIRFQGSHHRGGDMLYDGTGLLIENSAKGAGLGQAGIKVERMFFTEESVAGIHVVNSDGIRIQKNDVEANAPGAVGIALDATSDVNLINDNSWNPNGGTDTAFVDDGSGNCGAGNNFAVASCP
jgi:nitrous oxidase accessory protein NosD